MFFSMFQNHTAVGRQLDILEATHQTKYASHDSILHGYLHFEALSSHDHNFSCVNCGDHPAVVVMDLHKKGVFKMAGMCWFSTSRNVNSQFCSFYEKVMCSIE